MFFCLIAWPLQLGRSCFHFTEMGRLGECKFGEDRSGFVLKVKVANGYACRDINLEMLISKEVRLGIIEMGVEPYDWTTFF